MQVRSAADYSNDSKNISIDCRVCAEKATKTYECPTIIPFRVQIKTLIAFHHGQPGRIGGVLDLRVSMQSVLVVRPRPFIAS
jgi:hypothetical protein